MIHLGIHNTQIHKMKYKTHYIRIKIRYYTFAATKGLLWSNWFLQMVFMIRCTKLYKLRQIKSSTWSSSYWGWCLTLFIFCQQQIVVVESRWSELYNQNIKRNLQKMGLRINANKSDYISIKQEHKNPRKSWIIRTWTYNTQTFGKYLSTETKALN